MRLCCSLRQLRLAVVLATTNGTSMNEASARVGLTRPGRQVCRASQETRTATVHQYALGKSIRRMVTYQLSVTLAATHDLDCLARTDRRRLCIDDGCGAA
jgi:hypothetical protein